MKKLKAFFALAILATVLMLPEVAAAQTPGITLVRGTTPMATQLKADLQTWLNANPPSSALYYAPTSVTQDGADMLISLAGLALDSPEQHWHLEAKEGEASIVMWLGTVRMHPDGSGELYSDAPGTGFLLPSLGSVVFSLLPSVSSVGGGPNISWPFDQSAMYGPRGVHGQGDYGTSGMYAVDLLGGESLGVNAMSNRVYASADGDIDYVCEDDTSVAVRTHAGGNYFLYAHLMSNANLTNGYSFSQGSVIGTLKSGSFDDTCGWAQQGPDVYHVHWMFTPAGGEFQVANCVIDTGDTITCGGTEIQPGGWINGGNSYTGDKAPSFWDNPVAAIAGVVAKIVAPLPEHNSPTEVLRGIANGMELVFRLAYVFARGNLNLLPLAAIILIVLTIKILLSLIWLVWWAIRALYNIIPAAA